ncbi:transglycosylase SLT domain-containing protein [Halomonas marinisediminis]|uniref:LysM peptidoglycan-binding domain-containing protein n=1 Tax=Halomonas marinisediminis TaxID=2546095 RepID=A0ABY2DAW0_9GAMM|nr:transglycosylase SLT domain-containing protein [Halomonas marinisediminis]TDB05455.1 LysM peptidoglycan-binding domain-containing protein [Halomonas marinisediminis]
MTYYTTRRRLFAFASSAALLGALMTAGAQIQAATFDQSRGDRAAQHATFTPSPRLTSQHFWNELAVEPRDAWSQLRDSFQWQDERDEPRVQAWIDHYRQSPHNIAEITERARPWLAWITQKVEERGLPGEIALIPFIESSFDPSARSHRGAAGLWQFMPRTGDSLGLSRQRGYDGRLDVVASTYAALDYIEYQADQWYEGDLELSLAAYNAGAGTVNKARRRALAQGRSGDYWSLSLPRETMNYVPKLKAIAAIIDSPEEYQVTLPAIENAPAFAKIPVERPLRLDEAARLAGVSKGTIAELNPGVTGGTVLPGNDRVLLVPAERADAMLARLDTPAAPGGTQDSRYRVQRGDTLAEIAALQGISVAELRQANGLSGNLIRPGQTLELPTRSLASR